MTETQDKMSSGGVGRRRHAVGSHKRVFWLLAHLVFGMMVTTIAFTSDDGLSFLAFAIPCLAVIAGVGVVSRFWKSRVLYVGGVFGAILSSMLLDVRDIDFRRHLWRYYAAVDYKTFVSGKFVEPAKDQLKKATAGALVGSIIAAIAVFALHRPRRVQFTLRSLLMIMAISAIVMAVFSL